jgi:hypothetical protein
MLPFFVDTTVLCTDSKDEGINVVDTIILVVEFVLVVVVVEFVRPRNANVCHRFVSI